MTNRELYRRVFSQVHPSAPIRWEDMKKMQRKKRLPRRLLTLAAAVAVLAALSGIALAGNLFGLRDLVLPQNVWGDAISLSGYTGSPESQALAQWQAFLDEYDADKRILSSVGNTDPDLGSASRFYGAYTREMADKLQEIAQSYGLKLHTHQIDLAAHPEAVADSCGDFLSDAVTPYWIYMYEDGAFTFDGDARTPGYGEVEFQFRRTVKGTFNDVSLNILDVSQYKQWTYRTPCGVPVTLALGPGKALVLADLPDCFVTCNVLAGTYPDGESLTRADLEALADAIDFTKLTPAKRPTLPPEPTPTPSPDSPRRAFAQVLTRLVRENILPDGSYADPTGGMEENEFAVCDVDGDGQEELILRFTGTITVGQAGYILRYSPGCGGESDPVMVEFMDYPLFTFYDNAALTVGISHNQGLAGDALWPYTLYAYTPAGRSYRKLAFVDAWNKAQRPTDFDGSPFPDALDGDGDGVLYFLYSSDASSAAVSEYHTGWEQHYGSPQILDGPEYRAWWEGVMGAAQPLELSYQSLTEKNIAQLLE